MNNFLTKKEIYEAGCLKPEDHRALVDNFYGYAAAAGLGGANCQYIWKPLQAPNAVEVTAFKNFSQLSAKGQRGLLYCGNSLSNATDRLMAVTGCMVRNYVDARFTTIEKALHVYAEEKEIHGRVLCIANFFMNGGSLGWKKNILYDFLLQLAGEDKLLFAFVQDFDVMAKEYGPAVTDYLSTRFLKTSLPK